MASRDDRDRRPPEGDGVIFELEFLRYGKHDNRPVKIARMMEIAPDVEALNARVRHLHCARQSPKGVGSGGTSGFCLTRGTVGPHGPSNRLRGFDGACMSARRRLPQSEQRAQNRPSSNGCRERGGWRFSPLSLPAEWQTAKDRGLDPRSPKARPASCCSSPPMSMSRADYPGFGSGLKTQTSHPPGPVCPSAISALCPSP